jgi:hypothetical protein
MKKIFLTLALLAGIMASAQVKIGDNVTTLNASSLLELESNTKGVLFPRVALISTTSFAPLLAHVAGMVVYNTATIGDVTPGLYTNNGANWVKNEGAPQVGLYGKPVRVHPIASSITWQSDDVVILLQSTHSGNVVMPSASANPNRIFGINNHSGSARVFTNQTGSDTGIYANEGTSQIANAACGWFISDGVSWRVYSGRP